MDEELLMDKELLGGALEPQAEPQALISETKGARNSRSHSRNATNPRNASQGATQQKQLAAEMEAERLRMRTSNTTSNAPSNDHPIAVGMMSSLAALVGGDDAPFDPRSTAGFNVGVIGGRAITSPVMAPSAAPVGVIGGGGGGAIGRALGQAALGPPGPAVSTPPRNDAWSFAGQPPADVQPPPFGSASALSPPVGGGIGSPGAIGGGLGGAGLGAFSAAPGAPLAGAQPTSWGCFGNPGSSANGNVNGNGAASNPDAPHKPWSIW
uniref:Uncharacterized protein n=1 Tax=Haptolina brevifila TaxID=156173 RepID=A0A7S2MFB7_9EUKA|mmetsp:Transcript_51142/g.101764  ORF Transcript_51142/g.101764 Transcript_51142/m.101764 type:complete len:267 (+) Transcript_51142:680-1480(+)